MLRCYRRSCLDIWYLSLMHVCLAGSTGFHLAPADFFLGFGFETRRVVVGVVVVVISLALADGLFVRLVLTMVSVNTLEALNGGTYAHGVVFISLSR